MTFLLLFNPCLRVQLVASIVSGDQSPEQRPAEQTYFSLPVWISTFAIHCWVFQAPKGGPDLRRIAPRCCHFHVPWVWGRLCSGVADWKALFYILAHSCPGGLSRHFLLMKKFQTFWMLNRALRIGFLSKCCVGSACNIYMAFIVAGTGSAQPLWTWQKGCLMEGKCCPLT